MTAVTAVTPVKAAPPVTATARARRATPWLALGALALALTSGCAGDPAVTGTWREPSGGGAYLELAPEGVLTGNDGCNGMSGHWRADGDATRFEDVVTTLMACEGVDTWLSGLSSATVSGDRMTVFDTSGARLGTLVKE